MSDAFIDSVRRQHDAVGHFIELLEQEQTLLTASQMTIDSLARLTERKAAEAAELETLDRARQSILTARGYTPDRSGAEQLAAKLDCLPLWQAFVARVDEARTHNQINGEAIDNRLNMTNRTLAFLQRAAGQTLYGPNGRTRAFGGNHSIRSGV